jgi:hypothetical protein
LQSELAQSRCIASDAEGLGQGFDPNSAQAQQWAKAIIDKCTDFASAKMRAMQFEHDAALQAFEQNREARTWSVH